MTLLLFIIIIGIFLLYIWWLVFPHQSYTERQMEAAQRVTKAEDEQRAADHERLMADARQLMRQGEALIQAELAGKDTIRDAILSNSYSGPWPERRDDGGWLSIFENLRILKIAGINRREGIDRYVGRVDCALVPEPDNEFDPEAIKVVADDRHHLGYVPADQTAFVRSLTAEEFPYKATAFIEEKEDEVDGHRFFVGYVYIKRLD